MVRRSYTVEDSTAVREGFAAGDTDAVVGARLGRSRSSVAKERISQGLYRIPFRLPATYKPCPTYQRLPSEQAPPLVPPAPTTSAQLTASICGDPGAGRSALERQK